MADHPINKWTPKKKKHKDKTFDKEAKSVSQKAKRALKAESKSKEYMPKANSLYSMFDKALVIKSKPLPPPEAPLLPPKYEGEMLERDLAAAEETERKKSRVALVCNKSAYQYIGESNDPEVIKNLGRRDTGLN